MKQYKMTFAALFLMGIFILSFTACKKEPSAQYSTWVVDGDTISTNDVSVDRGKAQVDFFSSNMRNFSEKHRNGFTITFWGGGMPVEQALQLRCGSQNPATVCMLIMHNDSSFISHGTQPEYIQASIVNGKARYTLQPTWFYDVYHPADSKILVSGVFNEP